MRRPLNPHNATPDDTGGGGEPEGPDPQSPPVRGLQQRRMAGRAVGRTDYSRRVTPNDHGGNPRTYLITIRKFDAATGEEVWNNGRGELHSQCSQIYSLGSDKFLACGSPTPGKHYGNLLHWADLGSSAAIVKASQDETDDSFNCTSLEAAVVPFRMAVGDDHIWLCGRTTATGTPRVVQAYDRTTLRSTGVLALPDDDSISGEDVSYLVNMAATADGEAIVARWLRSNAASQALSGRFDLELRFVDSTPAATASGEVTLTNVPQLSWNGSGTAFGNSVRYVWMLEYSRPSFTVADERLWFAYLTFVSGSPWEPRLASVGSDMVFTDHGALTNFPRYSIGGGLGSIDVDPVDPEIGYIKILRSDDYVFVTGETLRVASGVQSHQYDFTGSIVASWTAGFDAVDSNGSCFGVESVSFVNKLVRRDSGVVVWQANHAYSVDVVFTSGGHHYCLGSQGFGGGDDDIFKLDGATGSVLWTARHSDGTANSSVRDIVVVGDYVYVVGEGSTYEP